MSDLAGVEGLIKSYRRFVASEWREHAPPQQRVWFAIYEPQEERRLRLRLGTFEEATIRAGLTWIPCDLTDEFARWMAAQDYAQSYFEYPEDLTGMALDGFAEHAARVIREKLSAPEAGDKSVVAVYGVGSLFGLARVSRLMELVTPDIRGKLLIFFPGEHESGNYRLLDARDGWNYLAIPITAQESGAR
jgi:hypothetical protein